MGWLGRFAVIWLGLVPALAVATEAAPPRITARAALLMDAKSGHVLWARNSDLRLAPASTTKVMTALLALESNRLRETFAASGRATKVAPTKIHLRPGQRLRLEDLIYAILLNSANDAAVVIAEGLAGSVPKFAARMNRRARELGARNTHFVNPHGLPERGHYSTVRDLAKIFRYALTKRKFRQIVSTERRVVKLAGTRRLIRLKSHNRLLKARGMPVIGKTGYTRRAKRCFVGASRLGNREVIVALLGSTDLWSDTRKLVKFAHTRLAGYKSGKVQSSSLGSSKGRQQEAARSRAGDRYGIRLSVATDIARARRLRHAVGRRGFEAFVRRVSSNRSQVRYQVFVGLFPTRAQAERALRRLAAEVDLPAEVVVASRE